MNFLLSLQGKLAVLANNTHAYTNQSFAKQLLKESEVNFNWTLDASR